MLDKLTTDRKRFFDLIRQHLQGELRKLFTQDEFWARPGGGTSSLVKVKLPGIEIPHIIYGRDQEGVGQGEGKPGDVIGEDPPDGPITPGGGSGAGEHHLEVEFTQEELAQIILQDLELPRLIPKGKKTLLVPFGSYTGVRPVGPESLRIFKRSYKRALKRTIASGEYNSSDPRIYVQKEDKRYRDQRWKETPYTSAVLILLRDISGSMDEDFNRVVRAISRLFDLWIHQHYQGQVDVRYFLHDTILLPEVDQDKFYRMSWGGGTKFSPAYKSLIEIIDRDHPQEMWNVYAVHFTDGDLWDGDLWDGDNEEAKRALYELIPKTNLTAYFEVGPDEQEVFGWGGAYTFKREPDRYFGAKIKEFIELCAPRFQSAHVESPEKAYDAFVGVLK